MIETLCFYDKNGIILLGYCIDKRKKIKYKISGGRYMTYIFLFVCILVLGGVVALFIFRNRKKQDLYPLLVMKDELERETLSDD